MKAIYISGCIPYNGKSGGRLASYNHLMKISQEYDQIYAFLLMWNMILISLIKMMFQKM